MSPECSRCHQEVWYPIILPDEGPVCVKCLVNTAYGREDPVVLKMKGFTRDYHTYHEYDGKINPHEPYCAFLHSMEKDEEIPYKDNLYWMLDALPEGTVVEISVKVLGSDDRATDDPKVWHADGEYEILSRLPEDKQEEIKKLIKEAGS